jgi:erythromycin esterase
LQVIPLAFKLRKNLLMPKKTCILFTVVILLTFNLHVKAQDKITEAINKQLIALNTLEPDSGFTDLDSLKPYLTGKQVFGIGEATHGTHEFFQFKHRMLEFLVKEMGVKAFVMEGDFTGAQVMNDYVVNNKGTIKEGLKGIGFGVWMTQEVVNMCDWLKAYNATQSPENKVRFFGCDMQWASSSLKFLKDYLQPLGKFTPQMDTALVVSKKPLNVIEDSDRMIMRTVADQLSKIEFTTGDTALYHHYALEVDQYAGYLESKSKSFPARQYEWRDKCMAENCAWIYNYTGHQKMMIWAHNAHIAKAGGSMRVATMGEHLAGYFGDKYYAMGFNFFHGAMRSFSMVKMKYETPDMGKSKKGSGGAILAQCRVPNFIIDIKSASNAEPSATGFFNEKVAYISLGPTFYPKYGLQYQNYEISETFDALIFIKETTAVHNMN